MKANELRIGSYYQAGLEVAVKVFQTCLRLSFLKTKK